MHDFAEGSLRAVEILESLEPPTEGYKRLGDTRDTVAEAEIIVIYGNPRGSGTTDDMEVCVSTSPAPRDPPTRYWAEDLVASRICWKSTDGSGSSALIG
jgi:hypothetical protein